MELLVEFFFGYGFGEDLKGKKALDSISLSFSRTFWLWNVDFHFFSLTFFLLFFFFFFPSSCSFFLLRGILPWKRCFVFHFTCRLFDIGKKIVSQKGEGTIPPLVFCVSRWA
jgi:hypothetical protein